MLVILEWQVTHTRRTRLRLWTKFK